MKKFIIAIMCMFGIAPAYAENEPAATSKEYVDAELVTKQPTVPAQGNNVVMTFDSTATDGIGTKQIYDESASYASQKNALVTASTANAAVQMAIQGEFYCKEWSTIVENDCWLWGIREPAPHAAGKNLFDISKLPIRYVNKFGGIMENNGDGTITVTDAFDNSAISSGTTLAMLAPDLVVGNTYTLSFNTTGCSNYIYIGSPAKLVWSKNTSKTITQDMLNSGVSFYACYNGQTPSTAIISNIQIESGTTATAYEPYQNLYVPQNVQ